MSEHSYLSELNEAQRAAVEYLDGPELVIAGAGSGKTRVLTYKIVHLLAIGYQPWRILALTFTNKAAREMRERVEALTGQDVAARLWMGTFHSMFCRILRAHSDRLGFRSDFTIYDAADSKSLVKIIIRDMGLDDKMYRPGTVLNDISWAKNALFSPSDYASDRSLMDSDSSKGRPRTVDVYRAYVERCRIAGAMDFDDLLYYTNVLFRDNPDILEMYRERFDYVLVDEYQDTNFAQHLIVRQLCCGKGNLAVVGDDAQSIYSFRGANIHNILDLKQSFPGLATYKLERNYRSTRTITAAASSLIACNKMQIPKEVYSEGDEGERIEVVRTYNDYEEAYTVANRISQRHMRADGSYGEMAVLYRTNAQSRRLEEALRSRNIPYRVYGGLAFYQRAEVKDALAYFRLSVNPDDDEAIRRVINKPARGIGETTLNKLTAAAISNGVSIHSVIADPAANGLALNSGTVRKLAAFDSLLDDFVDKAASGCDASELAAHIMERTGLLQALIHENTPETISKRDNLLELMSAVSDFVGDKRESEGEEQATMADFLAQSALMTDQDQPDDSGVPSDRLTLMTIHAAKGLEFNNVFIVGAEEDLLPSAMSKNSAADVEEERRLMYVAITRARKFCMISYAGQRMVAGKTVSTAPSRFLNEISARYLRPVGAPLPMGRRTSQAAVRPSVSVSANSVSVPETARRDSVRHTPTKESLPSAGDVALHSSTDLTVGMRIEHPRFGRGVIAAVDTTSPDHRIAVDFATGDRRVLLLKFARFKIL